MPDPGTEQYEWWSDPDPEFIIPGSSSQIIQTPFVLTIYAPMSYTAPCIMFWMRAYPLRGEVGGGWALEVSSFFGPVKW